MRKGNKTRSVDRANLLAEERYLNRNVIVENEFSHNGMAPFMDVHKDGKFSDDTKSEVSVEEATLTEGIDPSIVMDVIDAAGMWIKGGGTTSVGGESVPTNLINLIMGLMPAAAVTGFVAQFWDEIKAKMGYEGRVR